MCDEKIIIDLQNTISHRFADACKDNRNGSRCLEGIGKLDFAYIYLGRCDTKNRDNYLQCMENGRYAGVFCGWSAKKCEDSLKQRERNINQCYDEFGKSQKILWGEK